MEIDMYKEHIIELCKHPLNYGNLEGATNEHRSFNPLCGDDITIQFVIKDGRITDVKFKGNGCAISMASASLLTDSVKGKTVEEVKKMKKEDLLELLQIPIGPVRLKCALISLEAAQEAIKSC